MGQGFRRDDGVGAAALAVEVSAGDAPAMSGALDGGDSEFELFGTFADNWFVGWFVVTAVAACQSAIGRIEPGCTVALGAVERDDCFVFAGVFWRWFVDFDAGDGRFCRNVIRGWKGH
jgi:hypothetical protein